MTAGPDTFETLGGTHAGMQVPEALDAATAQRLCPFLGKMSVEEVGLLLELQTMGNAIEAQEQAMHKTKTEPAMQRTKTEPEKPVMIAAALEPASVAIIETRTTPFDEHAVYRHTAMEQSMPQPEKVEEPAVRHEREAVNRLEVEKTRPEASGLEPAEATYISNTFDSVESSADERPPVVHETISYPVTAETALPVVKIVHHEAVDKEPVTAPIMFKGQRELVSATFDEFIIETIEPVTTFENHQLIPEEIKPVVEPCEALLITIIDKHNEMPADKERVSELLADIEALQTQATELIEAMPPEIIDDVLDRPELAEIRTEIVAIITEILEVLETEYEQPLVAALATYLLVQPNGLTLIETIQNVQDQQHDDGMHERLSLIAKQATAPLDASTLTTLIGRLASRLHVTLASKAQSTYA